MIREGIKCGKETELRVSMGWNLPGVATCLECVSFIKRLLKECFKGNISADLCIKLIEKG